MTLSDHYKRQFGWRDWPTVLDAMPPVRGATVLDLGCGVGDLAAEFVARGARVIGVDMNEELLREARSRELPGAEFRREDLRALPDLGVLADGLWSSFAAAYFPELAASIDGWAKNLKPGAWLALTEIEDLFGHEPLSDKAKAMFDAYAEEALAAGRYDFHMGHKLVDHVERCGFTVSRAFTLEDQELSFPGPARPDVIEAWRERLDGMTLLRRFCGCRFEQISTEFLECLGREDHTSRARVHCCIAVRRDAYSG